MNRGRCDRLLAFCVDELHVWFETMEFDTHERLLCGLVLYEISKLAPSKVDLDGVRTFRSGER